METWLIKIDFDGTTSSIQQSRIMTNYSAPLHKVMCPHYFSAIQMSV